MANNRPPRPIPRANHPQQPNAPQGQGRDQGNPPNNRQQQGGGRNDGGNRGNGGNRGGDRPPSCWLDHPLHPNGTPTTHATASFVEYLRWMREPHTEPAEKKYDPTTQLQLMQTAEEKANYQKRLEKMIDRTKRLAGNGNWFEVTCPWRIRVGGTKGPESMLLPAFDTMGMPYIPSSTLRGIARTYAIRHFMKTEHLSWEKADRHVEKWFGHLEGEGANRSGKIIFFDAYPTPSKNGGLAMDMANSIWRWEGDTLGGYSPNPNAFFSLKDVSFLIGVRAIKPQHSSKAQQVQEWLKAGLAQGVGSQVNSGYGVLRSPDSPEPQSFLRVGFVVQGQLIHGRQIFTQWNQNQNNGAWQMRPKPKAEMRSVAMKCMMRYWFRVFARGVLPANQAKEWEAKLFGGIDPKYFGYVCTRVIEGRIIQSEPNYKKDPHGEGEGVLYLSHSSESTPSQQPHIQKIIKNLLWMTFHLGGVGQGARRPLYSRKNRDTAPWWRGSNLGVYFDDRTTQEDKRFWTLPDRKDEFAKLFKQRLRDFYQALSQLSGQQINPQNLQAIGEVRDNRWTEAADRNCRIIVCSGDMNNGKPYALSVLHSDQFKVNGANYDGNLCGRVHGGQATPSPVWISNPEDKYQVVTVFGAMQDPRRKFIAALKGAVQIFPLTP